MTDIDKESFERSLAVLEQLNSELDDVVKGAFMAHEVRHKDSSEVSQADLDPTDVDKEGRLTKSFFKKAFW